MKYFQGNYRRVSWRCVHMTTRRQRSTRWFSTGSLSAAASISAISRLVWFDLICQNMIMFGRIWWFGVTGKGLHFEGHFFWNIFTNIWEGTFWGIFCNLTGETCILHILWIVEDTVQTNTNTNTICRSYQSLRTPFLPCPSPSPVTTRQGGSSMFLKYVDVSRVLNSDSLPESILLMEVLNVSTHVFCCFWKKSSLL